MSEELSLKEYNSLCAELTWIEPLERCCSSPVEAVRIKPLEGRNTLEVERTCIVWCPECGNIYWSRWD